MDDRINELIIIKDRLFRIANSYAGDETGHIAVRLHMAQNRTASAVKELLEMTRGD